MFEFFLLNTLAQTSAEKNSWPNTLSIVGQFFYLVTVCILICVLAYYSTKWLAKAKNARTLGSNLKIIEAIAIGNQSYLQLIQIGKRFFLISLTKEKIELLSEIDEQDIDLDSGSTESLKIPFEKYLNKILSKPTDLYRGEKNEENK